MTADSVRAAARELAFLHQRFAPLFGRCESREHSRIYIEGLLLGQGRKSVEPMALMFAPRTNDRACSQLEVLGLQRFLTDSPWQTSDVQGEIQTVFGERLVPTTAQWSLGTVGVIDESSFVKRGSHSVGVARQHCGRLGKVENCQVGVFLVGVTPGGTALLDHQLYLPEEWTDDSERCRKARVPIGQAFATKVEIARTLLERCQVRFDWITADDLYGRNGEWLNALEARGQRYVVEVPSNTRVWIDDPTRWLGNESAHRRPTKRIERAAVRNARQIEQALPPEAWRAVKLREGAAGPLVFMMARVRCWATRHRKAGPPVWLVIQRSLEAEPQIRYWLSNADANTPLETLAGVMGCRWRVEEFFEDAKGSVGMADYEARAWTSWHHHMSLVALAHLYVILTRQQLQEHTPKLTLDMALRLLQAALPRPALTEEHALDLVSYHLQRNAVAQASHRKTWLKKHETVAQQLLL
jgi:SRSO17 transposase